MTNEKSLQVAQGLSILSLLIASGVIDGEKLALSMAVGLPVSYLIEKSNDDDFDNALSEEDRARLLDAIEMVSP